LLKLQPDCVLIEGPPEGNLLIELIAHEEMRPPVAMLIYSPDDPNAAVFYPFAAFSPEWQAMQYALGKKVPVRFIDLPQTHWQTLKKRSTAPSDKEAGTESGDTEDAVETDGGRDETETSVRQDPLSWLARAAGHIDGERWWEHMVEQRRNSADLFEAIREAMTTLRSEMSSGEEDDKIDLLREAHMRQQIRLAEKEGFQRIAVVCGAWHTPALAEIPAPKEDAAMLKGLGKTKVEATWIPWTHSRLCFASGYGAGVRSPGWYHHLWTNPDLVAERWLSHVARLLRSEDLDASSASLIEAVRLAEALAALRDRPLPGLTELSEAIKSVLCFGSDAPMRIIHDRLIVGEMLGSVPETTPMVPLQADLRVQQKSLRLPASADEKLFDLDLRRELDLDRSRLLHRLRLLGIKWGESEKTSAKSGTFHEVWRLRWHPQFSLRLIERGVWGRTIQEATTAYACDQAQKLTELSQLTELLNQALLADLKTATEFLMQRVQSQAAIATDVKHLMMALPPLTQIARYGDVRKTDVTAVGSVIDGLVARICIGLPGACGSLDDAAAEEMFQSIVKVHNAIMLLQNAEHQVMWKEVLKKVADNSGCHGVISGRAARLLLELRQFDPAEAARRFGLALSLACDPKQAACWAEGFLRGSGLLLIHNEELWFVIDRWVSELSHDTYIQILPLLKRTFTTFSKPERRQMGELVKRGSKHPDRSAATDSAIDTGRAAKVLPILSLILGMPDEETRS
jgi:hypothetical protein